MVHPGSFQCGGRNAFPGERSAAVAARGRPPESRNLRDGRDARRASQRRGYPGTRQAAADPARLRRRPSALVRCDFFLVASAHESNRDADPSLKRKTAPPKWSRLLTQQYLFAAFGLLLLFLIADFSLEPACQLLELLQALLGLLAPVAVRIQIHCLLVV